MTKIIQMGSYGRNLGDTLALQHIRYAMNAKQPYKWTDLHFRNSLDIDLINQHDMLIVGGGGLIEGNMWGVKDGTHWKLPFTVDNLKHIKVPIVVFAVGLNFFRTHNKLSARGIDNLHALIDKSTYFSVRNDGSYEELRRVCQDFNVEEIADPGLIWGDKVNLVKEECHRGCFNVSINSPAVMKTRNISIKQITDISNKYDLPVMPHTVDDVNAKLKCKYGFALKDYNSLSYLSTYHLYDFAVTMRGHGQLLTFGKNIPSITLATQNKVSDFCKKYELEDYCVDTNTKDWQERLHTMLNLMRSDKPYLDRWYRIQSKWQPQFIQSFNQFVDKVHEIF